ncbi:MAG: flagellar basal body L-ring protein FlgH [Burkholderiaceae bacterium]
MKKLFYSLVTASILANLSGCAYTPATIVQTPLTTKPKPVVASAASNGAIFQAAAYRPMFEDRRARMVGDTLTITITEKTTAGKSDANSASKKNSISVTPPTVFGLVPNIASKLSATGASDVSNDAKAASTASNNFNGSIGVTVIEVLENGNLIVSGEKQVSLDKGVEFIRFSGVVNPDTILAGNTVLSTQVADARVEYRTNSRIDGAELMSSMSRFFYSLIPL